MSTIVANQRSAFVTQAMTAGKRLADALQHVSPAERASVIATVAAATATPVDVLLFASDPDEAREAMRIVDGVLPRVISDPRAYSLGANHLFSIIQLQKEPSHE